jgi:hypothetical protein
VRGKSPYSSACPGIRSIVMSHTSVQKGFDTRGISLCFISAECGMILRQSPFTSLLFRQEALGHLDVRFQNGPRSGHDLGELRFMCLPGQRGDGLQDALMHLNLM